MSLTHLATFAVLGLLAFAGAVLLLVPAIRKGRRSRTGLARTSHRSRTHAGTESVYWQAKLSTPATQAVTRTSGRLESSALEEAWGRLEREAGTPLHPLRWTVRRAPEGTWVAVNGQGVLVDRWDSSAVAWLRVSPGTPLHDVALGLAA